MDIFWNLRFDFCYLSFICFALCLNCRTRLSVWRFNLGMRQKWEWSKVACEWPVQLLMENDRIFASFSQLEWGQTPAHKRNPKDLFEFLELVSGSLTQQLVPGLWLACLSYAATMTYGRQFWAIMLSEVVFGHLTKSTVWYFGSKSYFNGVLVFGVWCFG